MEHGRKAFHFDLDVNKLRETYPSEHPKAYNAAWSKIKAFMEEHGFEHSQYSGYESVKNVSYDDAYQVIDELCDTYPWFGECVQAVTLTEIGERHDVLSYLRSQDRQAEPQAPRPRKEPANQQHLSLASRAENARRASAAINDGRDGEGDRNIDR